MGTWIVGIMIVLLVALLLWLGYEFVNAPLCDDDGRCLE